ncbi:MBL fold metallo-hydrolase [Quatrionicoccus australiensis]|uniref:MBL fold metallo-hydrolase n=1 Tax=Quatrionicoccus australiensis TaxID=138118 RepID=UPI001CFAE24F|nr:MBL fold metallo-hydrolase [Quatrionicoccus australiensis]MCB4358834.1 MBL fold metallo-hydrolase [Quatrionicoccus australiensis]
MPRKMFPALGLMAAMMVAAFPAQAASLQEAADLLGAAKTKSIEFSGAGHWYQFGQAPSAVLPWPQFDVSSYKAEINYETASAGVHITRIQADDPKRRRPAPTTQWVNQYVSGKYAWNLPVESAPQTPSAQPAAVEERRAEIWSTPQGFVKAALANNAVSKPDKGGVEVTFTVDGKYRVVGRINAKNDVEQVQTWIDTPVLGDTLVETKFSDYQDFKGVRFPARIIREQGGHPVLALGIETVKANSEVAITPPDSVSKAAPAAISVKSDKLAEGVFYLTGGTHHSVAIEQKDHVVLVEAPLNEARSLALIEKIKEIIPGKPIKTLVNSHFHFDHSGGLRTFVDAGATIVTHKLNEPYYKKAWAAPRSINPDRLAKSGKAAKFETFGDKYVISDGTRKIELHNIASSGHNDGFALIYLPAEKILIEADAFTPGAVGAPLPASPNPYSVNLYDNIQRLKLDVDQIAPLHGRLVKLADLKAAIGQK